MAQLFTSSMATSTPEWQQILFRNQPREKVLSTNARVEGGQFVQVLESDGFFNRSIQKAIEIAVANASNKFYLTTPYFFPTVCLTEPICNLAKRGVDVRVLTAGKSDVGTLNWAGNHRYDVFLKNGVRIFEMEKCTLHKKTFSVDGVYGGIGSYNYDYLSENHLSETNIHILDQNFVSTMDKDFQTDCESASEVNLQKVNGRPLIQKAKHWAAYQLYSFLYKILGGYAHTIP